MSVRLLSCVNFKQEYCVRRKCTDTTIRQFEFAKFVYVALK